MQYTSILLRNSTLTNNTLFENTQKRPLSPVCEQYRTRRHAPLRQCSRLPRRRWRNRMQFQCSELDFGQSAGNFANYTSLNINDNAEANSAYTISWASPSLSSLPATANTSFAGKFVDINSVSGAVSIGRIEFTWGESELFWLQ